MRIPRRARMSPAQPRHSPRRPPGGLGHARCFTWNVRDVPRETVSLGPPPDPRSRANRTPRSVPSAAAAVGSSDVSVSPGETLTSRICTRPAASTTASIRETSRRPSSRCAARAVSCSVPAPRRRAGPGSGRWSRPACSARCSRRRRPSPRPRPAGARAARPVLHDRHRDLGAVDEPLGQDRVGVGQAAHHRGRKVRGVGDHLCAERGAALVRLEHERQSQALHHRVEHGAGAQLAERRVRERHPVRGVEPGAGEFGLRGRLVPGPSAGRRRGAHERNAEEFQHGLDGAVLPLAPVQGDDDGVGPVRPQALEQRRRQRPTRARTRRRRAARKPAGDRSAVTPRARGRARRPAPPRCARTALRRVGRRVGIGRRARGRGDRVGHLRILAGLRWCPATGPAVPGSRAAVGPRYRTSVRRPARPLTPLPAAAPLGDPLRGRVAEREPQLPAAEPVGVEAGARCVRHPRRHGPRQHRLRVDPSGTVSHT